MASICDDPNGFKRVLFQDANGKRRAIRLGRATAKQAEALKAKVEAIVQDMILGRPHEDEVAKWLRGLNPQLRGRLERVGLVKGAGRAAMTLGAFVDEFFKNITVKASTATVYGHTKHRLIE